MNPKIKQKWIKALRSGKYKQGIYELQNEDKFCCLGVLCDLYTKGTGKMWKRDAQDVLPREVIKWAGLDSCNPTLKDHTCTYYNDTINSTFKQIALRIKRCL